VKRSLGYNVRLSVLFCMASLIGGSSLVPFSVFAAQALAVTEQSAEEPVVNTFTGKIVSQNGERLILRDDVNEVWYHLDDQQEARKFLGKSVSVTGVLDGRTVTIRVRSISEAKA
jgi:Protein of unknown function (DUF5818)